MKPSTQQAGRALSPRDIAQAAYELWEQAGRPTGRNMEFWLKAEQKCTSTSSLLPGGKPGQTADQVHANQFFESLRSIKFAAVAKSAAPTIQPPPSCATPPEQRPKPAPHGARSQRKRGGTGSSNKLPHGKRQEVV